MAVKELTSFSRKAEEIIEGMRVLCLELQDSLEDIEEKTEEILESAEKLVPLTEREVSPAQSPQYREGDKVRFVGEPSEGMPKYWATGTVREIRYDGAVGVLFDEPFPLGHGLKGHLNESGWYFSNGSSNPASKLSCIAPFFGEGRKASQRLSDADPQIQYEIGDEVEVLKEYCSIAPPVGSRGRVHEITSTGDIGVIFSEPFDSGHDLREYGGQAGWYFTPSVIDCLAKVKKSREIDPRRWSFHVFGKILETPPKEKEATAYPFQAGDRVEYIGRDIWGSPAIHGAKGTVRWVDGNKVISVRFDPRIDGDTATPLCWMGLPNTDFRLLPSISLEDGDTEKTMTHPLSFQRGAYVRMRKDKGEGYPPLGSIGRVVLVENGDVGVEFLVDFSKGVTLTGQLDAGRGLWFLAHLSTPYSLSLPTILDLEEVSLCDA